MILAYLDVNVIFDQLLRRAPFDKESNQIIELAKQKRLRLITDAQTIVFVFSYMVKQNPDRRQVKNILLKLLRYVEVTQLSKESLIKALRSDIPVDLEDAGQLEIAKEVGADLFVTRDVKFYNEVSFPVKTPTELLREFA